MTIIKLDDRELEVSVGSHVFMKSEAGEAFREWEDMTPAEQASYTTKVAAIEELLSVW